MPRRVAPEVKWWVAWLPPVRMGLNGLIKLPSCRPTPFRRVATGSLSLSGTPWRLCPDTTVWHVPRRFPLSSRTGYDVRPVRK